MKIKYNIINLTPHEVRIEKWELDYLKTLEYIPTYIVYPPSGAVARLDEKVAPVGVSPAWHTDGTPAQTWLVSVTRSQVTGLPAQEAGTYYIVSDMVFEACPNRSDLLVPYGLIRDNSGRITGCAKFRCSKKFFENESRVEEAGDCASHTKHDEVLR